MSRNRNRSSNEPQTRATSRRGGNGGNSGNSGNGGRNRTTPAQKYGARPVSSDLTQSAQQALHAQELYRQSVDSNQLRKPPRGASLVEQQQYQDVQSALAAIQKIVASLDLTQASQASQTDKNVATLDEPLPNTPHGVSPFQSLMESNSAPQATEASMFAPGAPLRTVPATEPASGPRQYNYPVGYNIAAQPRSSESTSASTLRSFALYYDGISLCEGIWFDIINRLEPVITFDENIIPDGESANDPKWRAISNPALDWVKKPDGRLTLHEWLTASARDVLELGYSIIFKQRDNAGRILALDLVDAALIKPLIDERGKLPTPPFAAYQQYVWGVPAGTYRADEMLLVSETTRTDSVYPFSRVERILLRINQALRKQNRDLRMFTDGAPPAGMLVPDVDAGWTPEQCEEYEQNLNDLLAGNDRMRARLKVTPPGATFIKTQPDDPQMTFDSFLLNVTAAAFGVTMDELGFTQDSNRSVGDSQENVIYRRVVAPLVMRYTAILTEVIKERFDPRLRVELQGFEEKEDALMKAQTLEIGVKAGAISPSRMAREMGWPVDVEVPPMVLTASGPIWLEDALALREAQLDAKLAGLEFAIAAPGQMQLASGNDSSQPASAQESQQSSDDKSDDETDTREASRESADKGENTDKGADEDKSDEQKPPPQKPPQKRTVVAQSPVPVPDPKALSDEYRRWYRVATRAASRGEPLPMFRSTIIPPEDYALLAHDLTRAGGKLDGIKAAFARARERERDATSAQRLYRREREHEHEHEHARDRRHPTATTAAAQHALRLAALHIFDDVARTAHHAAQ